MWLEVWASLKCSIAPLFHVVLKVFVSHSDTVWVRLGFWRDQLASTETKKPDYGCVGSMTTGLGCYCDWFYRWDRLPHLEHYYYQSRKYGDGAWEEERRFTQMKLEWRELKYFWPAQSVEGGAVGFGRIIEEQLQLEGMGRRLAGNTH